MMKMQTKLHFVQRPAPFSAWKVHKRSQTLQLDLKEPLCGREGVWKERVREQREGRN